MGGVRALSWCWGHGTGKTIWGVLERKTVALSCDPTIPPQVRAQEKRKQVLRRGLARKCSQQPS